MGVGASRWLSEDDVAKGRRILHSIGGRLREEAGIHEKRPEASLGVIRLVSCSSASPCNSLRVNLCRTRFRAAFTECVARAARVCARYSVV